MMNILITGAAGFVGKNLTVALESIRDGKDRTHPGLSIGKLTDFCVRGRCGKTTAQRGLIASTRREMINTK